MRNSHFAFYLLLTCASVLGGFNTYGDAYVSVTYSGFSPQSVTISRGQVVWWIQEDDMGPYSISSPRGYWWPYYLYDPGDSIGLQFNQNGDYSYYDAFTGNSGVVHVGDGPAVTISNPVDGAKFAAPASFTFSAEASGIALSEVKFYVGTEMVADVYSSPFSTPITNLAAGSYTLTAIAYNQMGDAATNSVQITVESSAPPQINLSAPRFSGNQFQFDVSGVISGKQLVLQSAPAAFGSAWTSIATNTASAGLVSLSRPIQPGSCFFRIVQLP